MCLSRPQKASSTPRDSQAVPHPSTNRALRCLTAEFGRDPVFSTRYGRWRSIEALYSSTKMREKNTHLFALGGSLFRPIFGQNSHRTACRGPLYVLCLVKMLTVPLGADHFTSKFSPNRLSRSALPSKFSPFRLAAWRGPLFRPIFGQNSHRSAWRGRPPQ